MSEWLRGTGRGYRWFNRAVVHANVIEVVCWGRALLDAAHPKQPGDYVRLTPTYEVHSRNRRATITATSVISNVG